MARMLSRRSWRSEVRVSRLLVSSERDWRSSVLGTLDLPEERVRMRR